jgi:hypothetical protein
MSSSVASLPYVLKRCEGERGGESSSGCPVEVLDGFSTRTYVHDVLLLLMSTYGICHGGVTTDVRGVFNHLKRGHIESHSALLF